MIIVCASCRKRYQIDIEKMTTDKASFTCKVCQYVITVVRPQPNSTTTSAIPWNVSSPPTQSAPSPAAGIRSAQLPIRSNFNPPREHAPTPVPLAAAASQWTALGLRSKMLLLFLAIPILIMIISAILYMSELNALSDLIMDESSEAIEKMGEARITDASRSVALQCKQFLETHPSLKREALNSNLEFRQLAVQKVGQTGYTSLYQLPAKDNVWRAWVHFDQDIIGQDLRWVKKNLGNHLVELMKIFDGVKTGAESKGYYVAPEKDTQRKKFLVCTPVVGTPYVIAATTFMDEFQQPVKRMQTRAKKITHRSRTVTTLIVVGTLILFGLIVSFYSYRLTERILTLTRIADEISVGDLDAKINTGTPDEIGRLAEAIGRMQDSIRVSIERLRKRR